MVDDISIKNGFTLIELLVTIAIVGILSTISLSVFTEYKIKAYNAASQRIAQDLNTALEAWKSTDWDQTTDSFTYWWHKGDNTNVYGGYGNELTEYYAVNTLNQSYSFNARIDTGCLMSGGTCPGGLIQYTYGTHCDTAISGIVTRYMLTQSQGLGTVWVQDLVAASIFNC